MMDPPIAALEVKAMPFDAKRVVVGGFEVLEAFNPGMQLPSRVAKKWQGTGSRLGRGRAI
jgi:hypothetical protein